MQPRQHAGTNATSYEGLRMSFLAMQSGMAKLRSCHAGSAAATRLKATIQIMIHLLMLCGCVLRIIKKFT